MKLRRRCLMASASQADLSRLGEDEAELLDGAAIIAALSLSGEEQEEILATRTRAEQRFRERLKERESIFQNENANMKPF